MASLTWRSLNFWYASSLVMHKSPSKTRDTNFPSGGDVRFYWLSSSSWLHSGSLDLKVLVSTECSGITPWFIYFRIVSLVSLRLLLRPGDCLLGLWIMFCLSATVIWRLMASRSFAFAFIASNCCVMLCASGTSGSIWCSSCYEEAKSKKF